MVATYAAEPDNATEWYTHIKSVEWKTPPPLAVGSRVAFVARFLGRRLAYTYAILEVVPGERLVMSSDTMETTYTWTDTPAGATRMGLRNRGRPRGFSAIAAPLLAIVTRRSTRNDLARLKRILESR